MLGWCDCRRCVWILLWVADVCLYYVCLAEAEKGQIPKWDESEAAGYRPAESSPAGEDVKTVDDSGIAARWRLEVKNFFHDTLDGVHLSLFCFLTLQDVHQICDVDAQPCKGLVVIPILGIAVTSTTALITTRTVSNEKRGSFEQLATFCETACEK